MRKSKAKKSKNQKAKKSTIEPVLKKKRGGIKWLIMCLIFIFLLIFLVQRIIYVPHEDLNLVDPGQKDYIVILEEIALSNKENFQSPRTLKNAIEKYLTDIWNKLDPNELLPRWPYSAKKYLQEFLDSHVLEQELRKIEKMQTEAQGKGYKLVYLPDTHPSRDGQTEASIIRGNLINDYLKRSKILNIFAEGLYYGDPFTWRQMLENEITYEKLSGRKVLKTLTVREFKELRKRTNIIYWFDQYVDQTTVKVHGIENKFIIGCFVEYLSEIDFVGEEGKIVRNVAILLNTYFREQCILANIITIFQEQNITEGILVLGKAHTLTFPALCKKWGVELEIVDLK